MLYIMCFSYEVSVATLIFSWSIGLYLLKSRKMNRENTYHVYFLLLFSLIQIPDAILWKNDMKRNRVNYTVTSFVIPTLLSAQVLFNIFLRNKETNPMFVFVAIFSVLYLFVRFNGYSVESSCKNGVSSPIWGEIEIHYVELVLFALVITYHDPFAFILLITILFPAIKYLFSGGYGSLWCAISNLLAIKLLMTA